MQKPFSCKIGFHSYETIAQHTPYVIEVRCRSCGKTKIMTLIGNREKR
jgi:hypothetical protein